MVSAPPKGTSALRKWLARLLPWLVTAAVVAYLVTRYSVSAIAEQMAAGNAWGVVPFAAFAVLASLFSIATADWLVLRQSLVGVRYGRVVSGKAGSSMLLVLGYGFGFGGYGLWLARSTGSGLRRTLGMISYIMIGDLTALCVVASVAVWLGGGVLAPSVRVSLSVLAPTLAVGLSLICLLGPRVLKGRLGSRLITEPWAAVSAGTFFASLVLRMLNVVSGIAAIYGAAWAFGMPLPLSAVVTFMPIIFLAGAVPINIGGFGAVQVAWVKLFGPWAPAEQVLAFQVLFNLALMLFVVARGLPFIARVMRDIRRPDPVTQVVGHRS